MLLHLWFLLVLLSLPALTHKQRYPCRINAPCGCSIQRAILSKIVGGEIVRKRSWNWLVSLSRDSNHQHFCGGSILSSSWILTAAHCVVNLDPSDIIIHAGLRTLNQSTQQRSVMNIFQHPAFDENIYVNDIALLQLSSPLDMADRDVAKICLPRQITTTSDPLDDSTPMSEYPPVNSTLVAIGWGQKTEDIEESSRELQQVTLKTIAYESDSCQQVIYSTERQFCAGVEIGGKDTCQGDSGGPLMKFSSSRQWILAGVTSFGYGCGRAEYPGGYTRVVFYSDWINETMRTDDSLTDYDISAHDRSFEHETINDIFVEDLMDKNYSHYHRCSTLYIVIAIRLSLYFT